MSEIAQQLHWVWVGLAVVFGILELIVPFFGFIFGSGACLIAAVCAVMHVGLPLQFVAFAAALLLSLFILRPRIVAKLQAGAAGVPSRTAVLVGRRGVVTQATDAATGLARATIEGQDWAVRGRAPLVTGEAVVVESSDGIVLLVRKV